jgi:hypothetical protein
MVGVCSGMKPPICLCTSKQSDDVAPARSHGALLGGITHNEFTTTDGFHAQECSAMRMDAASLQLEKGERKGVHRSRCCDPE